jgi:hypothetical protein
MSLRPGLIVIALTCAACGGKDEGDKKPAEPLPPATVILPIDAAVYPADEPVDAAGGVTRVPAYDPADGFHLDDAPSTRPTGRLPPREKKWTQILLRSSPSGAMAAVDGVRLGPTPVLWEGVLDGQPREFTFVMAGHALARYRFVPITGGIVHGTLVKITDDKDAGVPDIPQVEPPPNRRAFGGAAERPLSIDAAALAPPTPTVDAPLPPSTAAVDAGTGFGPTP